VSHRALNPEQFKDLFHHTSPENAESIMAEKAFRPGRHGEDVFFSEKAHGHWGRAGAVAVHVRVPAELAKDAGTYWERGMGDPEGSEKLYTVERSKIGPEHIRGIR
jgi:hypothetical protein